VKDQRGYCTLIFLLASFIPFGLCLCAQVYIKDDVTVPLAFGSAENYGLWLQNKLSLYDDQNYRGFIMQLHELHEFTSFDPALDRVWNLEDCLFVDEETELLMSCTDGKSSLTFHIKKK
jgi:hypothetical protein